MVCKTCGKEFFEDWRKDKKYKRKTPVPTCCSRLCSSKYSNSFSKRAISTGRPKGIPNERKGKTKENDPASAKISVSMKGKIPAFRGQHHSKETREKLSRIQSQRIEEAGHGGFLDVKYYIATNLEGADYSVRGTWELKVAEWLTNQGRLWERKRYLLYVDSFQVKRTYVPDFYLPETQEYWEIKGYFSEKDKNKLRLVEEQNNLKIRVLQFNDLKALSIL
jgi:hypothetical protein